MTTMPNAVADSLTMLRRNLRHGLRYPSMTIGILAMPVLFLLMFTYVLGGALGAGIGGASYVNYLAPGIILLTMSSSTVATSVAVCVDVTEGFVARVRTMAVARTSLLTGHVVGSVLQTLASSVVVVGIALLVGFRPSAGPLEWLAVAGLVVLVSLALTWMAVALGLLSRNPEGASNIVLPLSLLPFIGSSFVPTDSMSAGVRWFAQHQPFTPINETLRGLLTGGPIGDNGWFAIGWSVVIAVGGYLWARRLFDRDPVH
jgi:ABC-2 type transport system permease protein